MKPTVAILQSAFSEVAARLSRDSSAVAVCSAGCSRLPDHQTYLVSRAEWGRRHLRTDEEIVVIRAASSLDEIVSVAFDEARSFPSHGEGAVLGLCFERNSIAIGGIAVCEGRFTSLGRLSIVGSGFPMVRLGETGLGNRHAPVDVNGRWSRTAGALGINNWYRFSELRYAIVGCGRNGSLIATSLARAGATEISLIDPDQLEAHSLAEGDFAQSSVSLRKAEACTNFIRILPHSDELRVEAFPHSVFALRALSAIKKADILISCVDSAEARFSTAWLAKLYLKPLVDIGTGILNGPRRPMGADIRFILPDRCLQCFGGISGLNSPVQPAADWRSQRAGSLRSLNQIATGFGLRLIEDFVGGRLGASCWIQLDFNSSGIPQLATRETDPDPDCELCLRTGTGDAGLRHAAERGDLTHSYSN